MIKTYCDMCGNPIDGNINGVNIDFNHYGCVKFKTNWEDERQLCIGCATRVLNFINCECEKIKKEREKSV